MKKQRIRAQQTQIIQISNGPHFNGPISYSKPYNSIQCKMIFPNKNFHTLFWFEIQFSLAFTIFCVRTFIVVFADSKSICCGIVTMLQCMRAVNDKIMDEKKKTNSHEKLYLGSDKTYCIKRKFTPVTTFGVHDKFFVCCSN